MEVFIIYFKNRLNKVLKYENSLFTLCLQNVNMASHKHINWLNFGTFDGACLFVCGFSYENIIMQLKLKRTPKEWVISFESTKSMWDNDNWGFASKRTIDGKTYFFLVLKNIFDFKDDSHARLAHEILHLSTFHLTDFLNPIDENECFAYTHTHLMKQVYKILRTK